MRPTHLVAASPSALLDTLFMLIVIMIDELNFYLFVTDPFGYSPYSPWDLQFIQWERWVARERLRDLSRVAAHPITIVKRRVTGPFLESLRDLGVLGGHDPNIDSVGAIVENRACGRWRSVLFQRAMVRAIRGPGYPHIIVEEG